MGSSLGQAWGSGSHPDRGLSRSAELVHAGRHSGATGLGRAEGVAAGRESAERRGTIGRATERVGTGRGSTGGGLLRGKKHGCVFWGSRHGVGRVNTSRRIG